MIPDAVHLECTGFGAGHALLAPVSDIAVEWVMLSITIGL